MTMPVDEATITVEDILRETATMFRFTVEEILGPARWRGLVRARHLAMYLCRTQMGLSYPAIARAFNREDHTTVMHAVGKIDGLVVRDRHAASQLIERTARLQGQAGG
jgi:chromosomal replication initiator protein